MDKQKLRQVLIDQQRQFRNIEGLIHRDIETERLMKGDEAIIISGIRRCGKSSLLRLIANDSKVPAIYLNFDDIRLANFTVENMQDLQDLAVELAKENPAYFFDEIQNVPQWERWINTLQAQGIKVWLTGSNASLLSSEISTYLTGRNKVLRLAPFSFGECLRMRNIQVPTDRTTGESAHLYTQFLQYLQQGGFPAIVRTDDIELSRQYFEDMLYKDIIARHNIRQEREIKDLLVFLTSNSAKKYSFATLRKVTGISSLSTIRNYIEYAKSAFLLQTIDRFDYSLAKQKISSAKPYPADNSFLNTISFSSSPHTGVRLESLVFQQLRSQSLETYYHQARHECDFVIRQGTRVTQAIQVCADLSDPATRKRELAGLQEAMDRYRLKTGTIITMEQKEDLPASGIAIVPAWQWLLDWKKRTTASPAM